MRFILLFIFFTQSSFADCPDNSGCSDKAGKKRSQWMKALREGKSSQHLALKMWMKGEDKTKDFIVWDSPCAHHRAHKIFPVITYGKNFKSAEKKWPNLKASLALGINKGKIQKYLIPRDEAPLFFRNNSLGLTLEDEGQYFSYLITPKGQVQRKTPPIFPLLRKMHNDMHEHNFSW